MKQDSSRIVATLAAVALGVGMLFKIEWLLWTAFGLLVVVVLSAFLTEKIAWVWTKLGQVLGFINSRIVLGIVYLLILTPLAFAYRFFKKDHLALKRKSGGSMYVTRDHTFVPKDLEQMW